MSEPNQELETAMKALDNLNMEQIKSAANNDQRMVPINREKNEGGYNRG